MMISKIASLASVACLYLSIGNVNVSMASDVEGDFLYNVDRDIVNEYRELYNMYSTDLDNYSEIDITNSSDSNATIVQYSPGIKANNRAKIKQSGYSNSADISQVGRNNVAYINQEGTGNTAVVGQIGGNSEALISQDGNHNLAVLGQANFSGQRSQLSIDQKGNHNVAFMAGSGGDNLGISQDGHDLAIVNASSSMRIFINQAN